MPSVIERHFEIFDRAAILICAGAAVGFLHFANHDALLLEVLKKNRAPVYTAMATFSGIVFGFAMPALTIVLAFVESPRLRLVRESRHWPSLWRIFTLSLRAFAYVAVVAISALIFDKDDDPNIWFAYATIISAIWGLVRLNRLMWAFERVVAILTNSVPRPPDSVGISDEAREPAGVSH